VVWTTLTAGRQVVGYISNISTKVTSDGVVYYVTISTVAGEEYVVRLRQPADWLFVGTPVSGKALRVDDVYQIQDFCVAKELAASRVLEVDSCQTTYIGSGPDRKAIVTGQKAAMVVSAPALTITIARKAEKIGYTKTFIHIADLPTGARVVAVQTPREYQRDRSMRKLMEQVGADEQQ